MPNSKQEAGPVHTPVLLNEILEFFEPQEGKRFIDATLNGGGHTRALAERGASVLGIEWDPELANKTAQEIENSEFSDRVTVINDSYVNLATVARERQFIPDGILFDLGLSSWHYEHSGRGFSFKRDEPLDMRFDPGHGTPVSDIVNTYEVAELEQIIRDYGEEQFSRQIAQAIGQARKEKPILTAGELAAVIESAVPGWYRHRKIHPATKTFQALRVVANDELTNVQQGIEAAIEILPAGGKVAVISFQGHEDKIVREFFKEQVRAGVISQPTRRTTRPSWSEQQANPRSRSAKLKIAIKN
ncbi:MAG TPA: 16S rRNA (cytosine(1402)-N(4))-methyltransferase RsmH [Candidatus Paceibacterota bacterium]|nr:16S rRNA (cytosine(1402)-N(4))-methyltransferase RsmH [Candidatus Paceibacterota bacterium]